MRYIFVVIFRYVTTAARPFGIWTQITWIFYFVFVLMTHVCSYIFIAWKLGNFGAILSCTWQIENRNRIKKQEANTHILACHKYTADTLKIKLCLWEFELFIWWHTNKGLKKIRISLYILQQTTKMLSIC